LLERGGQGETGSITAIYTVLVEGSDMDEPIADEVRGILDGHIVLERKLAARGHYPAIDVLSSLSRVMPAVTERTQLQAAQRARALLAAYEDKRDLIALGAYAKGSDPRLDQAIAAMPELERFLCQEPHASEGLEQAVAALRALATRFPERR
jgi:flagellar biosynthesis/type III secretory pathway ATPase